MRGVKVAVVGLGYWGPNIVRVLHDLPDVEVAVLCDLDEKVLSAIARRYPTAKSTTSFEEALSDRSIDGVLLATPVATHFSLAQTALQAGKHVFVEKPMAASLAEAEALVELAEAEGKVLMPGHTFLYSPPVNAVRDLIQSGELGDIYFISSSRVNLGLHQPDASVVWDLGPHDFSILRYWLDELPLRASAVSRGCIVPSVPDVAFVNLEYPSGTLAHVEFAWLAPSKLRRTAIVGSRKMVVYDDTSNEPVRVFDSGVDLPDPTDFGAYRMSYRTGDIVSPQIPPAEPLALELADFCAAIRDGSTPRSSWEVGLDVLRTIDAVERSLECGGAPVEAVGVSSI